jgi:hypothetical protein
MDTVTVSWIVQESTAPETSRSGTEEIEADTSSEADAESSATMSARDAAPETDSPVPAWSAVEA